MWPPSQWKRPKCDNLQAWGTAFSRKHREVCGARCGTAAAALAIQMGQAALIHFHGVGTAQVGAVGPWNPGLKIQAERAAPRVWRHFQQVTGFASYLLQESPGPPEPPRSGSPAEAGTQSIEGFIPSPSISLFGANIRALSANKYT